MASPVRDFTALPSGEFAALAFRLWRGRATGILTVTEPGGRPRVLVLRRGFLMTSDSDHLGRVATRTLELVSSWRQLGYHFDGRTSAHPPDAQRRRFHLGQWAKAHIENQLDDRRAAELARELAGVRLALMWETKELSDLFDDVEQRVVELLAEPRRLDQLQALSRCPRFRLLRLVHLLRRLGVLELSGVAIPLGPGDLAQARRLLGIADDDTVALEDIKRAYRQLVRSLHPDLRPELDPSERHRLEQHLARINQAYRAVMTAVC